MTHFARLSLFLSLAVLLGGGSLSFSRAEEPETADKPVVRVSVEEARRQAELLHITLHSTLQLVHHRFYREDEGLPIPAAVVDEVFTDIESEQPVKLRWLVVEGQAMNTDHVAQDAFEEAAVKAIKAKKPFHEEISGGTYRRAAAITLTNHCLKCHVPDRKSTENRNAGLVVTIPVLSE